MTHSRSPLRILWPLALVLLIAGAWSTYWYIALEKAKESYERYVERNRKAGIEITCRDGAWSGYPFRFELRCSGLEAKGRRGGLDIDFSSGAVLAVALAYNPLHLIVEMEGPLTTRLVNAGQQRTEITSQGDPLRASFNFKLNPNRADQVSILATNQTGTIATGLPGADPAPAVPYELDRLNLHTRFAAPPENRLAPFDVAMTLSGLVYGPDGTAVFGADPLRVETASLDANITSLPYRGGQKFADRARNWQRNGGTLTVRKFDSVSNFLTGAGEGTLELDEAGLLNGRIEWRVSGFDNLMARLLNAGLVDEKAAKAAATLLTALGKPDKDGDTPGLKLRTTLKNGKLYFGPFRVANVPAVF